MCSWLVPFALRAGCALLVALVVFGAGSVIFHLLRGPWWPTIIFQASERPRIVGRWLLGTLGVAIILGYGLFAISGIAIATLIWLLGAPRLIDAKATYAAWRDDPQEDRAAALSVRNRLREAMGEPEFDGQTVWRDYILDHARASRRARYQPPGA
jgi:hypothetical protein